MHFDVKLNGNQLAFAGGKAYKILIDLSGSTFGPTYFSAQGLHQQNRKHVYWVSQRIESNDIVEIETLPDAESSAPIADLKLPQSTNKIKKLSAHIRINNDEYDLCTTNEESVSMHIENLAGYSEPVLTLTRGTEAILKKILNGGETITVRIEKE